MLRELETEIAEIFNTRNILLSNINDSWHVIILIMIIKN